LRKYSYITKQRYLDIPFISNISEYLGYAKRGQPDLP